MSPHSSDHPEGTRLPVLFKRRRYIARLTRRVPNGEEWRIETDTESYLFSVGYRWVVEHAVSA